MIVPLKTGGNGAVQAAKRLTGPVLELGCGMHPNPYSDIRHDRTQHSPWVNIAHDLDCLPWPWADASFAEIVAVDVAEHLSVEIADWLGECWRILQADGLLVLQVPHAQSWNAWADPTHRRAFHDITFDYWDRRTPWWERYGQFYFGERAQWWRILDRKQRRTETPFGELVDLQFVLQKDSES